MKTNAIRTLFAACITSLFLAQACDPVEPSTFTETFYAIGTILYQYDRVYLYADRTHETLYLSNIEDTVQAEKIGLKSRQRVIASLTLDAIGSSNNSTITINGFQKIELTQVVDHKPADSLNYYYRFVIYEIPGNTYPAIWAEGHIVNIAPLYHVPSEQSKAEFKMYPYDVKGDTLMLRLYSDIPDCDVSLNPSYRQTLISFDVSSINNAASNAAEQVLRDTIMARLARLNQSRIYVTVTTPDTLRAKNSKVLDKDGKSVPYVQPVPGLPVTIDIPFDFKP